MMIFVSAIVTHIWQSTLFAAAIGVATLAFRRNAAAIRHALWLVTDAAYKQSVEQLARKRAFAKSQIGNRQSQIEMSAFAKATA